MRVSVAVKKDKSLVTDKLADADELQLVDVDEMSIVDVFSFEKATSRDVEFARKTTEWDCEAIICGQIDKEAFEIVASDGVTRYFGVGHGTMEAIAMMQAYKLPLIREYDGGPGCKGAEAWHKLTGKTDAGCGCGDIPSSNN